MLARNQVLPSAVLEGQNKKVTMKNRLCLYSTGEIETIEYVLFCCPYYQEVCIKFVSPIISKYPGCPESVYSRMLLTDENPLNLASSTRFLVATY